MHHVTARRLTRKDYKTLTLAALGGALEFYDFIIFVFFAAVIGEIFFPAHMPEWLQQLQTFAIFAVGYFVRPVGGLIMAHFGDRVGRKKMFSLSILLMALPTLAMGLLPTYNDIGIIAPLLLLLMRILQGIAVGGEVPGAWVFVAEHVPSKHIGLSCGLLTAGLTSGILFGALIASVINKVLSPHEIAQWGWRIPFIFGGISGLGAMYLRRWLQETPVFLAMSKRKALAKALPLKLVVMAHKKGVFVSMLLTWVLSAGVVVVILMTPTYLQKQFAISAATSLQANSVAILMLIAGCISAGVAADYLGAAKTFIIGSLFMAACSWLFYHSLTIYSDWLFVSYALVGYSVGVVGVVPFIMVSTFPAQVRFTGVSFSYNVAYALFGGLTPIIITLLITVTPLAPAYYMAVLSAIGVMIGIYLLNSRLQYHAKLMITDNSAC